MFIEWGTSRSRSGTSFASLDPSVRDVLTKLSDSVRLALRCEQMFPAKRSLRRTPIRRRPRRGRTLTREQWEELRARIISLDMVELMEWSEENHLLPVLMPKGEPRMLVGPKQTEICPAVVMDPSLLGTCYGPWRLDHVKDDPMMGVKADDDEWHLVNLCEAHDERGAKAGFQWNTANRGKERTYLREHRPDRP